jgi:hypothetical protein
MNHRDNAPPTKTIEPQPTTPGNLPDFLIIGAQKSSTTTIRDTLAQHPQVHMAQGNIGRGNELHFFTDQWHRGLDWYQSFFNHPQLVQGEKTPAYLRVGACHPRIRQIVPNAKLIISLRNPVFRAYSQWNHYNQDHPFEQFAGWRETSFETVLQEGFERKTPIFTALLQTGLYAPQIQQLLNYYPREQILIIIAERLWNNPDQELKRIQEFIGVDPVKLQLARSNRRKYQAPMNDNTRRWLQRLYQQPNNALFQLLGERISEWDFPE